MLTSFEALVKAKGCSPAVLVQGIGMNIPPDQEKYYFMALEKIWVLSNGRDGAKARGAFGETRVGPMPAP
ncbi:hypothetical protein [Streptosporangium sp. NPDC023615]|uniref:hypothetical protein n=1 Tax=Streptosporangium sp. NPDC023615 TaxID=3154794 RepID=UPI00343ADC17